MSGEPGPSVGTSWGQNPTAAASRARHPGSRSEQPWGGEGPDRDTPCPGGGHTPMLQTQGPCQPPPLPMWAGGKWTQPWWGVPCEIKGCPQRGGRGRAATRVGFEQVKDPSGSVVKSPPMMQEMRVRSLVGKIPWRRKWQPAPVFLPGESHRQRSLAGYSPRGRKESDMTEHTPPHS